MTKDKDIRKHAIEFVRTRNITTDNAVNRALVQENCSVTLISILSWIRLEENTGSFLPQRQRIVNSDSFVINTEKYEYLKFCLDNEPALYLDEMADLLNEEFNIIFTVKQISECLISHGITVKLLEYHAREQDALQRDAFRYLFRPQYLGGTYSSGQIVVFDETHSTRAGARRKRGRSRRGTPAFRRTYDSAGRGGSCSCLASFTIRGYLSATCYDTTNTGVNADIVKSTLLYDVFPHMNPYPAECSVLMLDNASVHDKHWIYQECHIRGILVFFLPPYSYDFSPIEKGFHMAKALLRRKYNLEDNINNDFSAQLAECVMECCNPESACNLFQHCFLYVSDDERAWACQP